MPRGVGAGGAFAPTAHSPAMTNDRETDINSSDRPVQAGVDDEIMFSEGVGGMPDLDDDERATVGDVDGDNVTDGEDLL
jgi:hypothetical protein